MASLYLTILIFSNMFGGSLAALLAALNSNSSLLVLCRTRGVCVLHITPFFLLRYHTYVAVDIQHPAHRVSVPGNLRRMRTTMIPYIIHKCIYIPGAAVPVYRQYVGIPKGQQ